MKLVSVIYEVIEALDLDNSATIKVSKFEKELAKYGFSLEDIESGTVLYYIIKHLLIEHKEVTIDFSGVQDISYHLVNDSLSRLSCEYGKTIYEAVKIVNVNEKYQKFVDACMSSYMTTIINTLYADANTKVMAVA